MANAKNESNMYVRPREEGGSILTTSLDFYSLKLHSNNYTFPPLIKQRNRGVFFLLLDYLHSFPRYFRGKSSSRVFRCP